MLTNRQIEEFVALHRLPEKFHTLIDEHYTPLITWLLHRQTPQKTLFLGINGAQGTGKSTLADFIKIAIESISGRRVALLSLDDFYLTKAERRQRSEEINPLLMTRGVPGTHDLPMLATCLARLRNLETEETLSLPRFDKIHDSRADPANWPIVTGPIGLIVLEGWCVGSPPQPETALSTPVNTLEKDGDISGEWRRYVNEQLAGAYARIFAQLDILIFLQAPDFESVYRWRNEQEQKLQTITPQNENDEIMSSSEVASFIQFFERLTRFNLEIMPTIADVTLELNRNHECVRSFYKP